MSVKTIFSTKEISQFFITNVAFINFLKGVVDHTERGMPKREKF